MTEIPGSRPWIIAVLNRKGGVGKTTTVLSLAAAIADSSGDVEVHDVDPQQSAYEISQMGLLPFRVKRARSAAELLAIRDVRGPDTILLDLPGNLDDTPVVGEVLAVTDFAIIPVVPERAAVTPTQQTAQIVAGRNLPYRVLLNLVDPLRGDGPADQLRALLDGMGLRYFRGAIRRYVAYPQSQLNGEAITAYRGRAWKEATEDVRKVQIELLLELGRLAQGAAV